MRKSAKKATKTRQTSRTKKGKSKAKSARIPAPSAIERYMARIGAEQRNFRRWVVKEEGRDGYHRDAITITLSADEGVEIHAAYGVKPAKEISPTESEKRAIFKEIKSANWPASIPATKAQFDALKARLKQERDEEPILYPFWSVAGTEILFVQQRVYKPNRIDKDDLPWTLFSDADWRMMEPDDGLLPLYGLDGIKSGWQIFIHEGAKTADVVAKLASSSRAPELRAARAACPWLDDLKGLNAVHLGWPGGAPNPHRIDWEPIRRLAPNIPVTLVCDHDQSGENAARFISRALNRRLWVLRFGNQFPPRFDLADPFPDDLFVTKGDGRMYMGPTFDECIEPATWATKWMAEIKEYELRPEFVEDWSYTNRPATFIHRQRVHRRYTAEEFNVYTAPFSDVKDVAALLRKYLSARAETLVYEPNQPSGRITFERAQVINIYEPSGIIPISGDVGPWLDFLEYLIPNPTDRAHVMKWDATLIARPDIRMTYSLLLISEPQGVGKTSHAEVLMRLVGRHNCSTPSTEEAIDPKFTTWRLYKRLAVIGEIYAGHSAKAYNQLKQPLTDDWVRAEEKYERPYQVKNWIHVHASSNSRLALKLDDNDRRWLVPGVTEVVRPTEYWRAFYEWLASPGALSAIAAWAGAYVKEYGPVMKGEIAPMSAAKKRTIEEGRNDGERLLHELGEAIVNYPERVVIKRDEISAWLRSEKAKLDPTRYGEDGARFPDTAEKIRAELKKAGVVLPERRFKTGGSRPFRIATNFDLDWEKAEWKQELAKYLRSPNEIDDM